MTKSPTQFHTTEELIEDLRQGKMVILVDDEDRENEGDLVLAADFASAQMINFMATQARGLICLAMSSEQVSKLRLPLMVGDESNHSPNKTAFTVSIEASSGVSTGISAADRAHTIRVASSLEAKPADVRFPGHVFPIRAQQGGVLRRAGHTEGSVDLVTLAGLKPSAVICEIMNEDGTMARVPDLLQYASKHQLKIGSIVDLIEYRLSRELLVEEIPTEGVDNIPGGFRLRVFRNRVDGWEHLVLQRGEVHPGESTLVRMHLDSYLRELAQNLLQHERSSRVPATLAEILGPLMDQPSSVLVLLRGNNRSVGIGTELKGFLGLAPLQAEMDHRDYGIGAQILRSIGATKVRLLSSRVDRRVGLKAFGIEIVEAVPLAQSATDNPSGSTLDPAGRNSNVRHGSMNQNTNRNTNGGEA